ncbi:cytochrome C biogenesis protein [Mannheimia granulomatis]|uniref:Cytochrome C biogenesis protein n=1 Tax=Mannheimia granulomatis TaxID=85402 RepID=A0A6G8JFD2_9PAST|nr:cytochrome C biogenesis protein [Mannheimia granulomatis]QIM65922.1 cytochrome C biogenesis protein [Mannheimia granulomatis]
METREQLSRESYQQAVKFAQRFAEEARQEFEREALQRYQFEKTQFEQSQLQKNGQNRPLAKTTLISLLAIFVLSSAYYWQSGRYQAVQEGISAHQAFQRQSVEYPTESKNDRYIVSLQNQLRENPNNGDLWYELGQAYTLNNDFDSALICYDNAEKLLGKRPAVLGAVATARYYDNGQKMTPEIQEIIDQALLLDKTESASLLLLASDSFLNNRYQEALDYWRKVLDGNNESIDRRAVIQSMEMARQMLQGQQRK